MRCGHGPGVRLMAIGAILIVIGLAVVAKRTFDIPDYWMPVVVGVVIFVIGLGRYALSRPSSDSSQK